MERVDKAVEYFNKDFNCAQSIFTTFSMELGIEEETALKLGTMFGGGARKGQMCGAVSGALMVLGLRYGHHHCGNVEERMNAHAIAEEFMNRFISINGTVVCSELLGYNLSNPEEMKKIRELGLFKTTCPAMVQSAALILEEMLQELEEQGENR